MKLDRYEIRSGEYLEVFEFVSMGITKYLDDVQMDFEIYGEKHEEWEEFRKDIDYDAFLVKRKI